MFREVFLIYTPGADAEANSIAFPDALVLDSFF